MYGYEKLIGYEAVKVKKLNDSARLPSKATEGSSGFDLSSSEDVILVPGCRAIVGTGLSFEMNAGLEIQIRSRSGLAAKHDVVVLNSPGTIDSDYRGEVKVILMNHGTQSLMVYAGDRIAQAVICYLPMVYLAEESDLSATDRGAGGFGSTGVK